MASRLTAPVQSNAPSAPIAAKWVLRPLNPSRTATSYGTTNTTHSVTVSHEFEEHMSTSMAQIDDLSSHEEVLVNCRTFSRWDMVHWDKSVQRTVSYRPDPEKYWNTDYLENEISRLQDELMDPLHMIKWSMIHMKGVFTLSPHRLSRPKSS